MNYKFKIINDLYSVCKLNPNSNIPSWVNTNEFYSITKTEDELSILCVQQNIPNNIECEKNWKVLKINSKLDFSLVGVISQISKLLAENSISIFVISTFDTDYICIKEKDLAKAVEILKQAGNIFLAKESS